jgi:two-component system nitrate/nitrite response regulator NarL
MNLLTNREREVTELVAVGMCNKEIARELGITEGTVKQHLNAIFRKTGFHNRTTLAVRTLTP